MWYLKQKKIRHYTEPESNLFGQMVTELITTDSGKTKSSPKSLKGAMKVIKKLKGRIGLGESSYFLYLFFLGRRVFPAVPLLLCKGKICAVSGRIGQFLPFFFLDNWLGLRVFVCSLFYFLTSPPLLLMYLTTDDVFRSFFFWSRFKVFGSWRLPSGWFFMKVFFFFF